MSQISSFTKVRLMCLELIGMGTRTNIRGTKKLIGAFRGSGKAPKISLQKSYNTPRIIN